MEEMEENANLPRLEKLLAQSWPPEGWRDLSLVVAVSGGPDSVALLRALAASKNRGGRPGRIVVGHFNHRLRPQADDDAIFVTALAKRLSLPLELGEADVATLAADRGDGIEAAARDARYAFLRQVAEFKGARYVVTGHTADDQVETVLFNVLRGTGLAGLAGIPRVRQLGPAVTLIRPLLAVRRCEVVAYLQDIEQEFCVDPSNASAEFTRNRLRQELLPQLRREFNPDIDGAIGRLAQLAGDAQRVIEKLAEELLDRCVSCAGSTTNNDGCIVNTPPLATADRHLVREMFVMLWRRLDWPSQSMGFAEWDLLAAMATAERREIAASSDADVPTKRVFPGGVVVEREPGAIRLTRDSK
jgi:tRNA(Ile)-lysidine synthase